MTWLYLPGVSCPSAPASEDLTSACDLPSQRLAASATWRGKPRQQRSWSRAWKTGGSIRRLSGLTLPPSTLEHGVEQWIASCRAIPASPTAPLGEGSAMPMSAGSPIASSTCSTAAGLVVSSARTCRGMRTDSSAISSRHWSDWVAALRSDCSARRSSVSPTDESGCSSWPTAKVERGGYTRDRGDPTKEQPTLEGAAAQWMTPNVPNGGRTASHATAKGRTLARADGTKVQLGLEHQAKTWPTPQTANCKSAKAMSRSVENGRRSGGGNSSPPGLEQVAIMHAGELPAEMVGLDIPASTAALMATLRCSPPARLTPAGPTSSPERRTLNPLFVEWLMGWPNGWTGSGPVETESSHWWQAMRGELSRLVSRAPAQGTLL